MLARARTFEGKMLPQLLQLDFVSKFCRNSLAVALATRSISKAADASEDMPKGARGRT